MTSHLPFKKTLAAALAIVILSTVAALVSNAFNPRGIPVFTPKPPPAGPMIEFVEVWKAYDAGKTLFIDSRDREEFLIGHIRGARSVPWLQREKYIDNLLAEVPKDKPIIVYCDGEQCESSLKLSGYLLQKGWRDVRVFREGFPVWRDSGMEVSTGEEP